MDSCVGTKRRRTETIEIVEEEKVFTDAEAAVYDRQIRLWGVEAQKRLNNANVLIIGMDGLGAEVAKNIILGGVKSVTMMDHRKVTLQDGSSQFLVSDTVQLLRNCPSCPGINRAAASLSRAQLLNPMVNVLATCASVDDKTEHFYKDFTVICAIGCKPTQIVRLDEIARKYEIKFFAADVFGFISYIFSDMGEAHDFTMDKVVNATKDKPEFIHTSEGKCVFPSFQEVLNVDWDLVLKTQKRKINPSTHAIYIIFEFLEKYKRAPLSASDQPKLVELRDEYLTKHNLTLKQIPDEQFSNTSGQLGPSCAITGGVLAQEIVKAISHRDEPLANFFVCNPETNTSIVESVYSKIIYFS